jgi:hypothetical protein
MIGEDTKIDADGHWFTGPATSNASRLSSSVSAERCKTRGLGLDDHFSVDVRDLLSRQSSVMKSTRFD